MTWSKFDDGYDEDDPVEEAWFAFPPNPVGLHVQATTACNRWLSDGVIKPRWITYKLPDPAARAAVLAGCVAHELFDLLPVGERRMLVDQDGNEITVGPFAEDRYLVHGFLKYHESALQIKARRAKDAATKRRNRASQRSPSGVRRDVPTDVPPDTGGTAPGRPEDSGGSPYAGADAPGPARPVPTRPDPTAPQEEEDARGRASDRAFLDAAVARLSTVEGLRVEEASVLSALRRAKSVGADPGQLVEVALSRAAEYAGQGTLRTGAGALMHATLDARERSAAAQLAAAGAEARAAFELRGTRPRRSSAEDDAAAARAEADRLEREGRAA